jgi:hypothetical protein
MIKSTIIKSFVVSCLALSLCMSSSAHAKIFSPWIAAKGAHSGGNSDLFVYFDGPLAGGLEGGVEFLNIDVFGEALLMGNEQYLFTGNLGFDFDFGEKTWLELGFFTGPIFFHFPAAESDFGPDWSLLTDGERMQLEAAAKLAGFSDLSELEGEFSMFTQMEETLSQWVFGWNLVRVRVGAGVSLFPGFHIGVYGQLGYHMLIDGEDIAAGAKNRAIDEIETEYMLPSEVTAALRKALGAKPVDTQQLNGVNYNAGVMARIQF